MIHYTQDSIGLIWIHDVIMQSRNAFTQALPPPRFPPTRRVLYRGSIIALAVTGRFELIWQDPRILQISPDSAVHDGSRPFSSSTCSKVGSHSRRACATCAPSGLCTKDMLGSTDGICHPLLHAVAATVAIPGLPPDV